ncbi:MAG: histidine kinase [Deltaproteobacteria bacterium]|nr:histidine kinase [Deltaproteobacteria bacterium]
MELRAKSPSPLEDGARPAPPRRARPAGRSGPTVVIVDTFRALLAPRRLVPIVLVCIPMVYAQTRFSGDSLAGPLGVLMSLQFVVTAPTAWRLLRPMDVDGLERVVRLLGYAIVGVVSVGALGIVVPRVLDMGLTFLTVRGSLLVAAALFLVGGWGLGRDIDLEQSLRRERARAEELAREAERAQLLALRSHLDPHFLFNTLNAIAEWCRQDGEVAERAILELSAMLRTVLEGIRAPAWPLARELGLVESLLSLYLIRDPQMFSVRRDLPSPLPPTEVPPMVLLLLAENAIKHGPAAGRRGEVELFVREEGRELVLGIENPGVYNGLRDGGDGLPTLQRRLDLAYGGRASFVIRAADGRTRAEMRIPLDNPRPEEVV